ncbi:MAG: single-stranded DNA-binding protein [Candidatus Anaerobiospirillum merdipullorum]|uniref:Single-stranded DNA-binding protein n=1 Tax=Candidatus Anaerobiospirillum merdipullorum TaxID=2838450 RepID=A0A9E2NSN4_9GAMM|nr:single-stranded DNA-binding protein [Candidatus Anaerobiospirillum merdipullorum]
MARGINKVILIGNLGNEPLCRSTHNGTSVTNISMVTNEVRRNMETGETTEYPEWHRVVMWGRLADIAKQYLHKGSQVYIEGKLRTRTYQDKQGQNRSITEIVADEMQMLGRAPGAGGAPMDNGYAPARTQANFNNGAYGQNAYNPSYRQNSGFNNGGFNGGNAYGNNVYGGNSGYAEPNNVYGGAPNAFGGGNSYGNNQYGANSYGQNSNPYATKGASATAGGDEMASPYGTNVGASEMPEEPKGTVAPDNTASVSKNEAEPPIKMSDDEIPF